MANTARWLLLAFVWAATAWTAQAHAECGGTAQCIGVGATEADALLAHHGNGPATFTLAFGNQQVGTTGSDQLIYVAAVTGPLGTTAVLGPIAIVGANAAEFTIVGGSCLTSGPVHGGSSCTIAVAFSPTSPGTKSATVSVPLNPPACDGCITGRVVSLAGAGTTPLPTASPISLTVAASTPTTIELANYIGGTGALTVRIASAPAHGSATLAGTRATYVPATGYLGPDSFTYDVTDAGGTSAPAAVTLSVVPRPDPSTDPTVGGLVRAQTQAARRFARAQIANIQSRLESLHRAPTDLAAMRADTQVRPSAIGLRSASVAEAPAPVDPSRNVATDAPRFPSSLVSAFAAATQNGSLNVSAASGSPERSTGADGLWVGGTVQFGTRDQTHDSSGLRFSTDGLSAGFDRRIDDRLALGVAVGYGRNQTDIGTEGSQSRTKGASVAFYGSYQPSANTYVDGVLGYGRLDIDNDRFVAAANDFARGSRKGDQWFGSIAAGYEHREGGLLLSPYGRLDFGRARLKQYSETGAGLAALTYFEQSPESLQLALGLRGEAAHEADFGWVVPRLRIEVQHNFKGDGQAGLAYADLPAGPTYTFTPGGEKRTSLLLGLGSDFVLRSGLKLGVDYQIQRMSGVDHNQAVRVWLAKELDGKGLAPATSSRSLFENPVNVDASLVWDDNTNRSPYAGDKLADRFYSLNVGKSAALPLSEHTRVLATGFVNGDKFVRYPGLDRFSGGGQAELQYRASGEFAAPTFGLQGRLVFDEHAGQLRSGYRYALGVTYHQSLTDRIDLFGALIGNVRRAESDVFDGKDTSVRFNVDYALARRGTLYVGGEYRRGDLVSTLPESHAYESFAKSFARDDAYGNDPRFAYRYDAKTTLWTLGYNLPLGSRDSLDFSARQASSKTTAPASPVYGSVPRYTANQYSVAYLMRF